MPKPKKGPRFGGGPAHQKLLLGNLAGQLFQHERIRTTEAKAKALRPLAAGTVQGVIEDVLPRMRGAPPRLSVAGGRDAGAHAAGRVASLIAPAGLDPDRIHRMLNGVLAPEIVVLRARRVSDGFDARF